MGMAAETAIGVSSMVAFANSKTNGPVHWADEDASVYLIGALVVGGGIGAAVGALVDSRIRNRELLCKK